MSIGSPMMSDKIMAYTCAGLQISANFPPLTADRRLRIVLISTMSAPLASSCLVTDSSSSALQSGFSNRAEPPPEIRSKT